MSKSLAIIGFDLDGKALRGQLSARRADEAGQLATRTKDDAERSGRAVNRAIEAMRLIEQSCDRIGTIIGVIDEIAFQTNLAGWRAESQARRGAPPGAGGTPDVGTAPGSRLGKAELKRGGRDEGGTRALARAAELV